jgi:hypothetical protein
MKQAISIFLSWLFAVLFSVIGLINCFFGNDPEFGIFILLLSVVFYPPLQELFQKKTRWSIPSIVLIVLGVFIFWASLGVGELLAKIQLMFQSF